MHIESLGLPFEYHSTVGQTYSGTQGVYNTDGTGGKVVGVGIGHSASGTDFRW